MPNRILKETICTSEDIAKLSQGAEILFYRLMVKADDFGAYYGNESIVKSTCYPLISDDINCNQVKTWIDELVNAGLIYHYTAEDGRKYIQFVKWDKHQQIRAKKRKFPQRDINCNQVISDDSNCPRNPIQSNTKSNPNPNTIQPRAMLKEREDEKDDGFQKFWAAYPKKNGGDIREAFMEYDHAVNSMGIAPDVLTKAAAELADATEPEEIRYLPNAAKWLRNRGWESKVVKKAAKKNVNAPVGVTQPTKINTDQLAKVQALIGGGRQ